MPGTFDSDAEALRVRETLNARSAAHDLEAWILDHVRPRPGMQVLDLGCGTGTQLFPLLERIVPGGPSVGLELAAAPVGLVGERIAREIQGGAAALERA